MARKVFYSFHYQPDNWRASQVRNMGIVEGNSPATDNAWEAVEQGGDAGIKNWIDDQMVGRSCAVILIGNKTAGRKWIKYEIEKAWNDRKGVLGIYVHNLKDSTGSLAIKGVNPFDDFTVGNAGKKLSEVLKVYDPPFATSTSVYRHINDNLAEWIEKAIEIRSKN